MDALGQKNEVERLRRENAELREALVRSQNLVAIAPAFFGYLSSAGVVLDLNDLALQVIEARREDVTGRIFWEAPWWAPLPESAARVRAAVAEAAAGRASAMDIEYASVSGGKRATSWVALSITPLRDANGAVSLIAAAGIDITERRRSEDALRHNQRRLDAILQNLPAAVYLKDLEGRYLLANPRARRLKGHDILGRTDREIFPPAVADAIAEHDRTVLAAGKPIEFDEEIPTPQGTLAQLSIKFPIPGDDGTPVALGGISTDITERKRMERLRRDFLAVVGHELRNPLNSIMGSAEVMKRSGEYNERAVERILRQTRQLERIITDLQEAHNIDAGQLRLRPRELDLLPLLRACVDEAASVAGNHQLHLESDALQVLGNWDGDRVCQVLRNLLSNAVKYSPRGGEVEVRVATSPMEVRVSITDHGPGIPKEALPRLFERYYRGPATAESVPGMGVGLFVCRELIERHGGKLTVASEVGHGSTFTFALPRQGPLP